MPINFAQGGAAGGVASGVSQFTPFPDAVYTNTVIGIGTIPIVPIVIPYGGAFTAGNIYVSNSFSATNAGSSNAWSISAFLGVYTRNLSTLSLASSGSQSYAFTVTGSSSSVSFQGLKAMTIPLVFNGTPGNYWYALSSSTSSAAGANAIAGVFSNVVDSISGNMSGYQGIFGQSTAVSMQPVLGYGSYSVTSAAFPAAIGFSEIIGSAIGNTAVPIVNFVNYSA